MLAAPLNPLDVNVAAGRYHGGHPPLPYVPGCECVGRDPVSGRVSWAFGTIGLARDGGLAERIAVPQRSSSTFRTAPTPRWPLHSGSRVSPAGSRSRGGRRSARARPCSCSARRAPSASSRCRRRAPRRGSRRRGRPQRVRARAGARAAGADDVVRLGGGDTAALLREACGGEGPALVVDVLWGEPLAAAVEACARGARIVHLGQSAGTTATLASNHVRGKSLELYGLTVYAVPRTVLAAEFGRLVSHAVAGGSASTSSACRSTRSPTHGAGRRTGRASSSSSGPDATGSALPSTHRSEEASMTELATPPAEESRGAHADQPLDRRRAPSQARRAAAARSSTPRPACRPARSTSRRRRRSTRAVAAAKEAFAAWRAISLSKRAELFFRIRELFHEHREDLARLLTAEHGKVSPTRSARSRAGSR